MCRAVVNHDHERAPDQLPWLFHEANRISGQGQRRSHSQGRRRHCCALPSVTSTVCDFPAGSTKVNETLSPGALERTAATNASALLITRSSTLVTTTPLGR